LHFAANSQDRFDAISKKERIAYITRRWEVMALALPHISNKFFNEIGGLW